MGLEGGVSEVMNGVMYVGAIRPSCGKAVRIGWPILSARCMSSSTEGMVARALLGKDEAVGMRALRMMKFIQGNPETNFRQSR